MSTTNLLRSGQSKKDLLGNVSIPSASLIKRNILLIVDPQIDFHPEGGSGNTWHPHGSLAIPGANEDSSRIATMLKNSSSSIDEIYVTLDTHHVSLRAPHLFQT